MTIVKSALCLAAAASLALPAFAADCYSAKGRGGSSLSQSAAKVMITYKNDTKTGIAAYVKDYHDNEERIWLDAGEKVSRTIKLKRDNPADENSNYAPDVNYKFELSYSPSASQTELLNFKIKNVVTATSEGVYHTTRYVPEGSKRNNVSCNRTWRANLKRWDVDIAFK